MTSRGSTRRAAAGGADAGSGPRRVDRATTAELAAALAAGETTLVVPLGSTEQHGNHLPLCTDTLIADALAERLVLRHPEAWHLAPIPLGCAHEHLGFAGTMSLAESTLHAIVIDVLASAAQHGFERAFVFSAHGGNVRALGRLARSLDGRSAGLDVCVFADLDAVASAQATVAARLGVAPEAAGQHAGEWETSVIAALAPGLARLEALEAGHLAGAREAATLFYPRLDARVPSGVIGDPRGADAARAEAYLSAWVDVLDAAFAAAFDAEPTGASGRANRA